MGSILVPLFWLWCGASIVALIVRSVRRKPQRANIPPAPAPPPTPTPTGTTEADPPTAPPPAAADAETRPSSRQAGEVAEKPKATRPVPTGTVRSLAEALAGIEMPCDLAPLMGTGPLEPTHLVFITHYPDIAAIGPAVADELERIGAVITPVDHATIRADRGSAHIEVRFHPDGGSALNGSVPAFPTAPVGSVVVEFRLR